MLLKNDPRIARNTRNNTKRVEPTFRRKAKKISTLNKQGIGLITEKDQQRLSPAGLMLIKLGVAITELKVALPLAGTATAQPIVDP